MKESVQRAFSFLLARKADLGIARDLDTSDLHVEVSEFEHGTYALRGKSGLVRLERKLVLSHEALDLPRNSQSRVVFDTIEGR